MTGPRLVFENLGVVKRGALSLRAPLYTIVTGGPLSGKSVVARLVYLLWLPVQPLPPLPYHEVFKQNLEALLGSVAGKARVAIEGCGARVSYEAGEARVETRFRPEDVVEEDERAVESVKRFCFEGLGRSLYRGDSQRCIHELRAAWSTVLVHEALTCKSVRYSVDASTGLPRAVPPAWIGFERLGLWLCSKGCEDKLYTVHPVEFTLPEEGLVARLTRLDKLTGALAEAVLGGEIRGHRYRGVADSRSAPLSVASVTGVLSEAVRLLAENTRSLMVVEEPGLGLHPIQSRIAAWLLLRLASWGHSIVATSVDATLLAEARLQYLLYRLYSARPATASEMFADILARLGVGIDRREAARLAKSVLLAASRLKVVVVEGGEAREHDAAVLVDELPGVSRAIIEQVEETSMLLEEVG